MIDEQPRTPSRTTSGPVWLLVTLCILFVAIILVACGPSERAIQAAIAQTEAAKPTVVPTLTPVQVYADEMELVLESIPAWIEDYDRFVDRKEGWDMLGIHWINLDYPMAWSKIADPEGTREKLLADLKKAFLPADDLLEIGRNDILSIIATITPAPGIEVAHNQIVKCIQYKIDWLDAILVTLVPADGVASSPKLPDDAGHCDVIEASVTKVNQFVLKHQ